MPLAALSPGGAPPPPRTFDSCRQPHTMELVCASRPPAQINPSRHAPAKLEESTARGQPQYHRHRTLAAAPSPRPFEQALHYHWTRWDPHAGLEKARAACHSHETAAHLGGASARTFLSASSRVVVPWASGKERAESSLASRSSRAEIPSPRAAAQDPPHATSPAEDGGRAPVTWTTGPIPTAAEQQQQRQHETSNGHQDQAHKPDHFFASGGVSWESLGLSPVASAAFTRSRLLRPSAVQALAIPALLRGRDALVAAETGSGKTHTYLAAILEHALQGFPAPSSLALGLPQQPPAQTPQRPATWHNPAELAATAGGTRGPRGPARFALVLCPNATLCRQVMEMALRLRNNEGKPLLTVEAVVGREGWPSTPPQLVVATPGALINHLFAADPRRMRRTAFVRDLALLVVDEADMLLSGGYIRDVSRLLGLLRLEERAQAEAGMWGLQGGPRGARKGAGEDRRGEEDNEGEPAQAAAGWAGDGMPGGDAAEALRPWTDFFSATAGEAVGEASLSGEASAGDAGPLGIGQPEDDGKGGYEQAEADWQERMPPGSPLEDAGPSRETAGRQARRGLSGEGIVGDLQGRGRGAEASGRRGALRLGQYFRSKQYVFVAATMPEAGKKSVGRVLEWQFPQALRLSGQHLHQRLPSVETTWLEVNSDNRASVLLGLLRPAVSGESRPGHTLIFANSAEAAESIARLLRNNAVECSVFHKGVPDTERAATLLEFQGRGRGGTMQGGVLVCTDAGSRGIDIPNITHVIQAEFALSAVDFLHRVGRTGRAGQQGRVTCLFTADSRDLVSAVHSAVEGGSPLDSAFSRKRSFRKKLKKYGRRHD